MTARIVDQFRVSETVPLDFPVEFEGQVYNQITVRSPTVADVADFAERVSAAGGANLRLPMFDAPEAVLDALSPDDDYRLTEVAERFLPRRFRAADKGSVPASDSGEPSRTL